MGAGRAAARDLLHGRGALRLVQLRAAELVRQCRLWRLCVWRADFYTWGRNVY